jgi:hypothetical protein
LLFSICKPSYCCPKAKFETINTMSVNLFFIIGGNVPALGEVAKFGTDYFLSKIKFLARNKREFTTKFAILPNACCATYFIFFYFLETRSFFPI